MSEHRIACPCPGTPHPDGDSVTLRETLDFRSALAVRNAFVLLKAEEPDAPVGELLATLTEQYLLFGICAWSVVDEQGAPRPVSKGAIRDVLLSDPALAAPLADAADALYAEKVILPLLRAASTSSPPTPTEPSISVVTVSSPESPTPSSPFSTSTSLTADTETTSLSPVGVSS